MKLDEFADELSDLDSTEKLEWLVEFADQLPAISSHRAAAPFPETCRVQECQTPVHLWVDVKQGRVHLEADVPQKSPTVRGLVALVVVGLEGEPVDAVRNLPDDLISALGLGSALGMTRQQGFRGVVARLKQAVRVAQGEGAVPS
jgi:cysteine desulfuration protein SufE